MAPVTPIIIGHSHSPETRREWDVLVMVYTVTTAIANIAQSAACRTFSLVEQGIEHINEPAH